MTFPCMDARSSEWAGASDLKDGMSSIDARWEE